MGKQLFGPCPEWEEDLAALPEDLTPARQEALTAHRKECERCAAVFADYQNIYSFVQTLRTSDPFLSELFGSEDTVVSDLPGLPLRPEALIGREAVVERVLEGLKSSHAVVSIVGPPGIGKTVLAIEVAYQCVRGASLMPDPLFDFVAWVSARGHLPQERPEATSWLEKILDTIAWSLDYPFISQLDPDEKRAHVEQLLSENRVLLIIDNFEIITDQEVLTWMQRIPARSRVLITSSHHPLERAWHLRLEGLTGDDALDLIRWHAQRLRLPHIEYTRPQDLLLLVSITRGNPQAIGMVLGYVKSEQQGLAKILDKLRASDQASLVSRNICDRLFTRSWALLSKDAIMRSALLAMTLFQESVSLAALAAVAGLEETSLEQALIRLVDLSLLAVHDKWGSEERRYSIHPLTRAFVCARLEEDQSGWAQQARERWVTWYLAFTKQYGGLDGQNWAQRYELIEEEWENLHTVMEWCALQNRYELRAFWRNERLLVMTSIYGYHWKERVDWLQRIQQMAEACGDEPGRIEALTEQGFTLTQMGRRGEAQKLLDAAWKCRHRAEPNVQITLAEVLAQLYRKISMKKAEGFLLKAEDLLKQFTPQLNEIERSRHWITIQYYYGVINIEKGKREQAEHCFITVHDGAREIGWQRGEIYAQEFLADIAKARGRFTEAQELLEEGLKVAEQNKDRRRAAYYKRSLAFLAYQREKHGSRKQAIDWAEKALEDFTHLGMQSEVIKLEHFLDLLSRVHSVVPASMPEEELERTKAYLLPLHFLL